jgi:hypothetical protein
MKLYRVEVSGELYVLANSPNEANLIAIRQKIGEASAGGPSTWVHSLDAVPEIWRDAWPFCEPDDSGGTIRELFARGEIET